MRRAKKEGRFMGKAPLGYINKITEAGKKYVAPHPEKAAIMKWVFDQLAVGSYTTESIWKIVRPQGLKCSKNAFWTAIRNPFYCGDIFVEKYNQEDGVYVKGQHEPLISRSLLGDVQDALNGRKKKQRVKVEADTELPLRGFLICPKCQRILTGSASKGRNAKYYYYHRVSSCGSRFKAQNANELFVRELKKWQPKNNVANLYRLCKEEIYNDQQKSLRQQQYALKNELHRLIDRQNKAREMLLEDNLDPCDYRKIKTECEQATKRIEAKLAELPAQDILPRLNTATQLLCTLDSWST